MSLKDLCVAQNSKFPYIKSLTGGKDNSIEKLQVGASLDRWKYLPVADYRPSVARHTRLSSSSQTRMTGITTLSTTRRTRPSSRRLSRWSRLRPFWISRMEGSHEGPRLTMVGGCRHIVYDLYDSQQAVETN